MKKLNFVVAILFTIGVTPVFAKDWPGINNRTAETFNREFKGATNVHWSIDGGFQQARFVFLEHLFVAYFTEEGDLLGTARDILFKALPLPVMKSFERRFGNASDIIIHEVVNEEGTIYWFTLYMGNKQFHVKSDANGNFLQIENIKNTIRSSS
jgi:hypothetical protein